MSSLLDNAGSNIHKKIYELAAQLFPIQRSITGEGVRDTLEILRGHLPHLKTHEVPSGTQAFDWEVPNEWEVRDGYIADLEGHKIVDFKNSNLHVLGYSQPVNRVVSREELEAHLYSLPDQPEVIPYVTSYYDERWGFCLSHNMRQKLIDTEYKVVIDTTLKPGYLSYGELYLPGRQEKEVLFSTYTCHPSLANDNVSGVVVATFLAKWLQRQTNRKWSYRFLFIPETIGSIVYLSRHWQKLKESVIAGYVLTCVGDNRMYSFVPSRNGNTLADKVALHVLKHHAPEYKPYTFLDRGSDERQYCSPGIDLPVASILRSKYGAYPEYHTSADNMSILSPEGLGGAYEVYKKCIHALEHNNRYKTQTLCEPRLGKTGLMSTLSIKGSTAGAKDILDLLVYCDGKNDLIDIANHLHQPIEHCVTLVKALIDNSLIEAV